MQTQRTLAAVTGLSLMLSIPALGADWVTGNLHKWYFVPRGCAVLWARSEKRAELHPTVISHGYGAGMQRSSAGRGRAIPPLG